MHSSSMMIPSLLFYYGLFLILCGIVAVSFIGMKAKTALASGGTSGVIVIVIGHFISTSTTGAALAGVVVTLSLLVVFSWRSTKTLYALFEMIPARHPDVKAKGIAFLIISLMAVTSLMVLLIELVHLGL
jgi:hypothetical protein